MKYTTAIIHNEQGVVLVLSIFMLALLSMIGMASMMTSTTEVDIAANEKFHQIAFYQAESGLTIGTEIIERVGTEGAIEDWVDASDYLDANQTIKINDLSALREDRDIQMEAGQWGTGEWSSENQTEDNISLGATLLAGADTAADFEFETSDFYAECDIDKADVDYNPGSGAEFGSGADGQGSFMFGVVYNLDCIGRVPANKSIRAEHVWGYLYIE